MADAQLKDAQREGLWLCIRYRFFQLTSTLLLNEHPEHARAAQTTQSPPTHTLHRIDGPAPAGTDRSDEDA